MKTTTEKKPRYTLASDGKGSMQTGMPACNPPRKEGHNKYQREIKPAVFVDVYDVLVAFNVTCPAMAHAIKKCLAPGQRGVKSSAQDKAEAVASIQRSIEIEQGRAAQ